MSTPQTKAPAQADPVAASLNRAEQERQEHRRALLAKVRMIRDGQVMNAGRITNGDPNWVYFWVYNHSQEIDKFLGMEAQLVLNDDQVQTTFRREDGRHVRGDTVLMKMRRDLSEAFGAHRDLTALDMIENPKDEFLDWAQRSAVPASKSKS